MRPKKIIVLVDSDEQRMSERKLMLETHGYRVREFRSGTEAFICLVQDASICVALLDEHISGIGGERMCGEIKEWFPSVKTVLFSDLFATELSAADRANSVEGFRHGLQRKVEIVLKTSAAFRHAERFGLVTENACKVVFHF